MHVLIAGGGLGGLCLAQGLRRHGVGATVFERDPALASRPQGYRLHIDERAATGLRQCLSPERYDLVLATAGRPSRRITVLSEQLRELRAFEVPGGLSTSVDRATLRGILLAGLPDVRFGSALRRYETLPGGRIRAHLDGGGTADGDVLVGADGVGSAVRSQYLPAARVIDTGTRCVYGRTPLAAVDVPAPLWDGFCAVTDRRRLGMALGVMQFRESGADDYVMWSLSARAKVLDPSGLDPAALRDLVADRIRGWHPALRALVDRATPEATSALTVRTSVPYPGWPPTPVTLLGDAIHAMPPSRGSGANLALLDAGRLCEALVAAAAGRTDLAEAIGGYEREMRRTGYAAVRAASAAGGGPVRAVTRTVRRLARITRRASPR